MSISIEAGLNSIHLYSLNLSVKHFSLKDLIHEFDLSVDTDVKTMLLLLEQRNDSRINAFKDFLNAQTKESSVFNSWIEQNKSLKNLLLNDTISEKFVDSLKWRDHFLYEKFKAYVSPFFLPLISRKANSGITSEWAAIFSYFELISDDERMYLEQVLYQKIKIQIDAIFSKISKTEEEAEFQQQLLLLLSEDCIAIHNCLSRASHSLKIELIERILRLFYHPKCSAKLAHWMILQLEKMNLNIEQKRSLETIKNKIKSGEIIFSLTPKKNKKLVFRNALSVAVSIGILGLIYFIYNQKFEVGTQNFKEASSLTVFTVQERKEIDSLLRSMKVEEADSIVADESYFGTSISLRVPFKNKKAEKIYREIERDMSNHYSGIYDTCSPFEKKKLKELTVGNSSPLKDLKGKKELEFKNDSEYSLIILLWEESSESPVYSAISAPKSTFSLKANDGMHLIILPGIDFGSIPSKNKGDFKILEGHFCSIDFNFEYAFQQSFIISGLTNSTNRILIDGTLGNVLNLSDAQGVLESL